MATNGHVSLGKFQYLCRTGASVPRVDPIEAEIAGVLSRLALPADKLRGRRIAVSVGSRGIASVKEIARAICVWLKAQGAQPFVFPGMGSHGGATAEGQLEILSGYGVTPEYLGAEIRASMESRCLGETPEGLKVYMDRNAFEADAVVVMNRVKPHTDFSGTIESGLLKMMAVGMGKVEGASQVHVSGWKHGFEKTIRAMSSKVLASGKILCGVAVMENELHQICTVRAAQPEGIVAQEEDCLRLARRLVPHIPFSKLHLLVVDEIGKNISGCGMDTKVVGRGVELAPGEAPEIRVIYVRDLTAESSGNAVGIGLADLMHERLYRKIDFQKTYINVITALNPPMARMPVFLPTDHEALRVAFGSLGSPAPAEQRVVWIRNTLDLARLAISQPLAHEAAALKEWRLEPASHLPRFDAAGDLASPLAADGTH